MTADGKRVAEGIVRRTNGSYLARQPWRGGQAQTFPTLAAARAWRKAQVRDAAPVIVAGTVGSECTAYVSLMRPLWRKPNTRTAYLHLLDHLILPTLAEVPADQLTKPALMAWLNLQAEAYHPRTANAALALLGRVLENAVDAGRLVAHPARRVKPLALPETTVVYAVTHEAAGVITAALPDHLRIGAVIAQAAGLRVGELLALQWSDIDTAARVVHVLRQRCERGAVGTTDPKYGSKRDVPFTPSLLMALNAHRALHGEGRGGLIIHEADGGRVTYQRFKRAWQQARRDSGSEIVGVHTLRHAFGSWLIDAGVSPSLVQLWMGHKSLTTTLALYVHPQPGAAMPVDLLRPTGTQSAHKGVHLAGGNKA